MASVSMTIDAGVLVVPQDGRTAEDAYRYVETLLDWSKILSEPWVAIYMSERASEALSDDDLFPLHDQLERLFAAKCIIEYAVNDVVTVVYRLLQSTPSFETYFSIRNVLAEQFSTEPDILRLCSGRHLQSDLARGMILIAILRRHCHEPIRDHLLILRHAPRRIINVRALVHDLEHDRNDLSDIPRPPEFFEGDVLVCDDFRGLVECLDESAIFQNATDDVGIETAIRVALYKSRLLRHAEPDWEDTGGLRLGRYFHKIETGICRGQTDEFVGRVLRAIVETLDGINLAAVHSLRTGSGGGNPQRMRSEDKAMRRDIDYEYHLHYWHCQDGGVELACIVAHNDFSIPE
ncbi:MAG: hypothetical protein ABIN18_07285 [Pseudomonadota bacterium]